MLAKSHTKGRHDCHPETPVNTVVLELSGDGVSISEDCKQWTTMACDDVVFIQTMTLGREEPGMYHHSTQRDMPGWKGL
eukprot:12900454-Prorocentrum_lima.AAC.1